MSWNGLDRRQFPRVIYPCLVKLNAQQAILTHTENIGVGGVCVTIKTDIPLFTPIDIELDLIDADDLFLCKGRVVWSVRRKAIEEVKPMFYDIGIEFLDLREKDRFRIQAVIDRLIKQGATILKPYV